MDLESIIFNEIVDGQRQILCFYLYVESKKQNRQMQQNKKKQKQKDTHTENKLVAARGEKDEGNERSGLRHTNSGKSQGCTARHKEYSQQYCENFVRCLIYKNIASLCCTPETNIIL